MKELLLVEDDLSLIHGLSFAIQKQGYGLETARTVREARVKWAQKAYDLVILDVALPDGTGFELCQSLREHSQVPIMFLTAADEESDIVMGLDIGADDYITKPFKLSVFLSKINAMLRRSTSFQQPETNITSGGIRMDLLKNEVTRDGRPVMLTAGETRLLRLFMQNPNIVLSSDQILSRLWDCNEKYVDQNTLSVYIRRLRLKIEEDPADPKRIVTMRGLGYKWHADV